MEKDKGIQKIVSVAIILMMILSTLAISANITDARPPENVPSAIDEGGKPALQVTELTATTPVVYLDQMNRLVLSLSNQGNATALKVTVNITDIVPKISEEPITTLNFGTLKPGMEKTRFIDWMPTVRGIHYIRVEMKCEYLTRNSPAEMVESEPTVLSAGFPVTPQADTILSWGPGGWPVYHDNNTVNSTNDPPTGIREVSGAPDNQIEIRVYEGLTIEGTGTLILNEYVNLVMFQDQLPTIRHEINISAGGNFLINSPSRTTTIMKSSNEPATYTYPFHNRGTINFHGATVWYTHGPSDLSLAGGIQNLGGSVCIINDCNLLEADTHSLYINGTADVQVRGAGTVIGSSVSDSVQAKGHGIFVNGATPVIEDVTVQYQKQDGIRVENVVGAGPITADTLHQFSSAEYDYQVTATPVDVTPMTPMVANGDMAHMIWVEEGWEEMPVQHLRYSSSADSGITWSAPVTLVSSPLSPLEPSIASDGEFVGIAFISSIRYALLIYSDDNGNTWNGPINLSPDRELRANYPSIDWQGDTGYVVFKTESAPLHPLDYPFKGIAYRTFKDSPGVIQNLFEIKNGYGIPKIAVDGNDLHVVICAPTVSNDVTYLRGYVDPQGWDEPMILTEYNVDGIVFDQNSFDLKARNGAAYFVWHNYDTDNYNIHYMKGISPFGETDWSAPAPLTADPGNSLYPSCAIDMDGNLLVVWQDDREGQYAIRYSALDSGGNLIVDDVCLTPDSPGAFTPSVSVDGYGLVYLAWEDVRTGDSEVWVKHAKQLVINRNTLYLNYYNGIYLFSSSENIITNNILSKNGCGIYLYYSDDNTIRDNNALDNTVGIFLGSSSHNRISSNDVCFNYLHGIYLWGTSNYNTISTNDVYSNARSGIYLYGDCDGNYIVNNNVYSNSWDGIWIRNSDGNFIDGNIIADNSKHPLKFFGIYLDYANSNTISNNDILNTDGNGIHTRTACYNTISGNTISNNLNGIRLNDASDNNLIVGNIVSSNNRNGISLRISSNNTIVNNNLSNDDIYLEDSSNNTFTDNTMAESGIFIVGPLLEHWNTHTIDTSNTVNGKPVYYWKNQTVGTVPAGAGQVILANCTNVVVENQNVSDGSVGISLGFSKNTNIVNNNASLNKYFGIYLYRSSSNTIANNTANSNNDYGIYLYSSSNNTIANNTANSNSDYGIYLYEFSQGNNILDNNASLNANAGIWLEMNCDNNVIANNSVFNNAAIAWVMDSGYGIYILFSSSNKIVKNTVSNNNQGIYLLHSSNNNVANNNASFNRFYGIRIHDSSTNTIANNTASSNIWHGIFLMGISSYSNIVNNTASNNGQNGIYLGHASNNNIVNNMVSNNGQKGIDLYFSSSNTIANNTASSNMFGIQLTASSNNIIINNIASSNDCAGIDIYYSSDNHIANNNISNNDRGIVFGFSDGNIINNNTISLNADYGLYIYWDADDNLIYHNNFIDNAIQAYDAGTNQWDNGVEGNYWSDYQALYPDAQEVNGIWDTPYAIPGGPNEDRYPLMEPVP